MSTEFTIKRGDTAPPFQANLKDKDGAAVLLDGATILFNLKGPRGLVVDRSAMTLEDATTALVQYAWQAGDTDAAGLYQAECEVTYANGKVETFPNRSFAPVRIHDDLG